MIRQAKVAGQFYSGDKETLGAEVASLVTEGAKKEKAIAIMCPHAGYIYSGAVAGAVYSRLEFPDTLILIGPNHTGLGTRLSIMAGGRWEIPTGSFDVDEETAAKLLQLYPLLTDEPQAHLFEHSLEVQLPFIAHFSSSAKIVPIAVMGASLDECHLLGQSMAAAIGQSKKSVTIVTSSDMSHYISDSAARHKDNMAIEKILALDPEGLYDVAKRERITMCGLLPATVMLYAARVLGAKSAELVKYATSAEVSGDYGHVVGYAGVIIT
ncbi:MAG: AmmeMemoRadiSam system protein B [Nitrospirae bacterium]|nr:AmmeMemoRadiSam system protein B [Nitrospirota bacterium]